MGTPGDFGQLYRNAFAERNLEEKGILLRRVQEQIDRWAHSAQTASAQISSTQVAITQTAGFDASATSVSLSHASVTPEKPTSRRGAHARSLSSAA